VIVETKVIVVTDLVGLFQQAPTWSLWPASRTQQQPRSVSMSPAWAIASRYWKSPFAHGVDYRRWSNGPTSSVTSPSGLTDNWPSQKTNRTYQASPQWL